MNSATAYKLARKLAGMRSQAKEFGVAEVDLPDTGLIKDGTKRLANSPSKPAANELKFVK